MAGYRVNFIHSNGMSGMRNLIQKALRGHESLHGFYHVAERELNIHDEHQAKSLGGWYRLHGVLAMGTRSSRWQSWSNTAP